MSKYEAIFIWITLGSYSGSFLLYLGGLVFKRQWMTRWGFIFLVIGFICHTGAILDRWRATGHLPVMRTYENSLTGTWSVYIW